MKPFFFLIGVCVACALGYMTEPALRPVVHQIVGDPAGNQKDSGEDLSNDFDYAFISADQMPSEVTLLRDFSFEGPDSGMVMSIKKGKDVDLGKVVGQTAFVTPKNTEYEIPVPASYTDLAKRASAGGSAETLQKTDPVVASNQAPEPPMPNPTAPPAEVAGTEEPQTATPPAPTPTVPEPAPPTPQVAAQPDPPVTNPEPTPTTSAVSPAEVVSIMKKSLESEEIKEFNASEVKEWNAGEPETVDGSSFGTGTVVYEKDTIFGLKRITAKAFIQEGKVVRWVWPKSGLIIQ